MRGTFLQRFCQNRAGVGAVEFALVVPFLLVLYMSGSELAMAVTLNRKVQHTAATVNDLVTQATSVSAAEIDGIFAISSAIIAPYPVDPLRIRVTSIAIDEDGEASVECSRAHGEDMTALVEGTPFTLPEEFADLRSRTLLVAETYYDYFPMGGYGLSRIMDEIEMGETSYLNPRIGRSVACADW